MFANYHTHTFRCGHASGTEREYIENAIRGGFKILGFSDHSPFLFPDSTESQFRVKTAMAEDYFETLNALREEYKDKIKIYIGFEMEYYPLHFNDMLKYTKSLGSEYYILGQHFIANEAPGASYSGSPCADESKLVEYADCVIEGMKTGAFKYVAHPDLFNFTGEKSVREREWRRICAAARELDIPLEINFLGIRTGRHYPAADFWKVAGEEKPKVIFGLDAHEPVDTVDEKSLAIAEKTVEFYGLTVVDELNI